MLFSTHASAKQTLRLGFLEYPPLVYSISDDVPDGHIIDYINLHLGEKFELEWIKIPILRARWAFESNLIDAYPFMRKTNERVEWALFFDEPYFTIQSVICSTKDINIPAESLKSLPKDIENRILVLPRSDFAFPFMISPRVNLIDIPYIDYTNMALNMLEKNRADYAFFPAKAAIALREDYTKFSCFEVGEKINIYFTFAQNNPLALKVEKILSLADKLEFTSSHH